MLDRLCAILCSGRRRAGAVLIFALVLAGCDSVEERVAKHFERGQALLNEGVPVKAILEFRNALQLDDQHAPSHFAIGKLLESRGDLRPAFARYRKVIEIEPAHIEARLKMARLRLLAGELEQASAELNAAKALEPDRADVQAAVATLALARGDVDAARSAVDLAFSFDPDNADAVLVEIGLLMRTQGLPAALARADLALDDAPENLALNVIKLQVLELLAEPLAVRDQLVTMIARFPDERRFREALIRWALAAGDDTTALNEMRALVAAAPDDLDMVVNLTRFVRRVDGDSAARSELDALIETATDPVPLELMRAQFDVETGNRSAAIGNLEGLVDRAGKKSDDVRIALARLRWTDGNEDEAVALVDAVLESDPNHVDALSFRVARLIDDEALDQAVQSVRRGLGEDPDNVTLLQLAGRAQERSGNLDLANDRLAKAVRADEYRPETVRSYVDFLMRSERFTAAETVLSDAIYRNPQEAELIDLLGFTRMRLGDWQGANAAASALAEFNPDRARQLRGAILIGQERFEEGASMLRNLPGDERQRAASVAALVQTYVQNGEVDRAVTFLEGMLAENPKNLQALGIRGNLHLAAGETSAAEAKYREVLALDPANGGAHSAIARLHALTGNAEAARVQLQEGLKLAPDNLVLLARLAQLYEIEGNFDAAIEVYDQLYERVPDSLLVANNLASLLSDHRAGDTEALERAYAIAGRLRPSDIPQYRDTYGWTRYLKGEYEVALERIEPVASALPENPWVHYHLGQIYRALDRPEDTRMALERALVTAGDRPFPPRDEIRAALDSLSTQ